MAEPSFRTSATIPLAASCSRTCSTTSAPAIFVENLIREAQNPDEYAFALGALAHYTSDSYGHPAVNRATASEYPRLRQRYGPVVLYDQDPEAHLQTEFGFDVLEVVQQRYAPEAFHDFIGFQVSKPVFERAFQDTYGLPLNLVLTKEDLAIGTYRRTVSTLLPKMTQVAVADFGKQMQQAEPTFVPKKLIYRMSRADYQKRFGNSYQRPGFGTRILAFFIKLIPKIGPLRDLSLRVPSADAQKTFLSGMDIVVDHYQQSINTLSAEPADHPSLQLPAVNLDTGKPTSPGSYPLADQTYARYLALLVKPRQPSPPPTPSAPWSPPQPPPTADARPASPAARTGRPNPTANRAAGRSEAGSPPQPPTRRSRHPRRHRALLRQRPAPPGHPPPQKGPMEASAAAAPDPAPATRRPTGDKGRPHSAALRKYAELAIAI